MCDIADLQPVYNDKGDLVSISQVKVPAGAVDLLADIDQGIAILPTTAIDSLLPNQPPTMEKK